MGSPEESGTSLGTQPGLHFESRGELGVERLSEKMSGLHAATDSSIFEVEKGQIAQSGSQLVALESLLVIVVEQSAESDRSGSGSESQRSVARTASGSTARAGCSDPGRAARSARTSRRVLRPSSTPNSPAALVAAASTAYLHG